MKTIVAIDLGLSGGVAVHWFGKTDCWPMPETQGDLLERLRKIKSVAGLEGDDLVWSSAALTLNGFRAGAMAHSGRREIPDPVRTVIPPNAMAPRLATGADRCPFRQPGLVRTGTGASWGETELRLPGARREAPGRWQLTGAFSQLRRL